MSKLSFRARALDSAKALQIYKADELTDLDQYSTVQRSVSAIPTGMEKEEEMELHLQRAISARQSVVKMDVSTEVYIPVPKVETERQRYESLYKSSFDQPADYLVTPSDGYSAVANGSAAGLLPLAPKMKPIVRYDADSEDEDMLASSADLSSVSVEEFQWAMEALEIKNEFKTVTLEEAKALLSMKPEAIEYIYYYWRNKRFSIEKDLEHLIPTVVTDQRFVPLVGAAYIAFRRRIQKMTTRKFRKTEQDAFARLDEFFLSITEAICLLDAVVNVEFAFLRYLQHVHHVFNESVESGDLELFKQFLIGMARRWRLLREASIFSAEELRLDVSLQSRQAKKQQPERKAVPLKKTPLPKSSTGTEAVVVGKPSRSRAESATVKTSPDGRYTFKRLQNCVYGDAGFGDLDEPEPCPPEFYPVYLHSQLPYEERRLRFAGFCRRRFSRGGRIVFDRLPNSERWSNLPDDVDEIDGVKVFKCSSPPPEVETEVDAYDLEILVDEEDEPNLTVVDWKLANKSHPLDVSFELSLSDCVISMDTDFESQSLQTGSTCEDREGLGPKDPSADAGASEDYPVKHRKASGGNVNGHAEMAPTEVVHTPQPSVPLMDPAPLPMESSESSGPPDHPAVRMRNISTAVHSALGILGKRPSNECYHPGIDSGIRPHKYRRTDETGLTANAKSPSAGNEPIPDVSGQVVHAKMDVVSSPFSAQSPARLSHVSPAENNSKCVRSTMTNGSGGYTSSHLSSKSILLRQNGNGSSFLLTTGSDVEDGLRAVNGDSSVIVKGNLDHQRQDACTGCTGGYAPVPVAKDVIESISPPGTNYPLLMGDDRDVMCGMGKLAVQTPVTVHTTTDVAASSQSAPSTAPSRVIVR